MTPTTALLIALALGAAIAAAGILHTRMRWLRRREVLEGRRILAGMRWRELSNLLVDALGSAGFEPEETDARAARGANTDPVLLREGQPWLVVCKQGLQYRVTPSVVEDVARTVRQLPAAGAVVATPGEVDAAARTTAANVEILDGDALWTLLDPKLPPSVHDEVVARAHAAARTRSLRMGLAGAGAAGVLAALMLAMPQPEDDAAVAATPLPRRPVPVAAQPVAQAPATPASTLSEPEQRRELAARLPQLPGIERAFWSTATTLQIVVADPALATDDAICGLVRRYELIRASRLQLDPPPGVERPVRFKQCASY